MTASQACCSFESRGCLLNQEPRPTSGHRDVDPCLSPRCKHDTDATVIVGRLVPIRRKKFSVRDLENGTGHATVTASVEHDVRVRTVLAELVVRQFIRAPFELAAERRALDLRPLQRAVREHERHHDGFWLTTRRRAVSSWTASPMCATRSLATRDTSPSSAPARWPAWPCR